MTSNAIHTLDPVTALCAAGCSRILEKKVSAERWDRPELRRLLDQLREGDVLVVWKLDRLSRSLKEMLSLLEKVQLAGAGFLSLTAEVETTTAAGRMMMQVVGAFAEFERAMLCEHTRNGLLAARQKGRIGGRRPKLTARQQQQVVRLVGSGERTAADAARLLFTPPPLPDC